MRISTFIFVAALFLAGCPRRDQVEQTEGGVPPPDNTIAIVAPTTTTYTNASVTITVSTLQPPTDSITILAGDAMVGQIDPPQTSFQWDTTTIPENTYAVTAQTMTNGKTITSLPVTIVVDRTAPTLTLTPTPGASDVVFALPIRAVSSEPLILSTVTQTFASVEDSTGAPVPTSLTMSNSDTATTVTVNITNKRGMALPKTFTATVNAAGVTDRAGNALVAPTTPWTWTVPDWIKLAPFMGNSPPLLAVGSDLHPAVLYTICTFTTNGCAPHLHIAINNGQGWADLGEPAANVSSTGASFALDAQNHPFVVATGQTAGGVAQVIFYSWTGSSWDSTSYPSVDVPAAAGYYVDATAVRLDPAGNPVVAYRANTTTTSDVYVVRWTGTAWDLSYGGAGLSGMQPFDFLLDTQARPMIATAAPVNGVTAWEGAAWVKHEFSGAPTASAAIDASGAPMMVNGSWRITHLTGGTWLPTVPTAITVGSSAKNPRIAATPDRQPVVTWFEPTPAPGKIGLARWYGGQLWDQSAGMFNSGGPNSPNDTAAIAVDSTGSVWLAWLETNTTYVWMSNY
jgi:hypothetical protein